MTCASLQLINHLSLPLLGIILGWCEIVFYFLQNVPLAYSQKQQESLQGSHHHEFIPYVVMGSKQGITNCHTRSRLTIVEMALPSSSRQSLCTLLHGLTSRIDFKLEGIRACKTFWLIVQCKTTNYNGHGYGYSHLTKQNSNETQCVILGLVSNFHYELIQNGAQVSFA